jgi:galactokinase
MIAVRALNYRAPGRVNLIGDHTDYNDGFVLPMALDLETVVRAHPRDDGELRLRSDTPGWEPYADAVRAVLRTSAGLEGTITSTVPVGAGLSSSATLEVALGLALAEAEGVDVSPLELALACQDAELLATGVPCGIMDQLASVAGVEGHALLIDCRSLEVRPIPLPAELAVVVVHSGVARELAGSEYAERRAACAAVAERLGLDALRDATPEQVADEPRARHVVSENARVLAAADALAAGDLDSLGPLLSASHASLRDDFEVSTPELDELAAALEEAGALGARLTGAGFGGCVVALARAEDADALVETFAPRYPLALRCRAAAGAGRIEA